MEEQSSQQQTHDALEALAAAAEAEGEKIMKAINSPAFKKIIRATKWQSGFTDHNMFRYFKPDFYKNPMFKAAPKTRKHRSFPSPSKKHTRKQRSVPLPSKKHTRKRRSLPSRGGAKTRKRSKKKRRHKITRRLKRRQGGAKTSKCTKKKRRHKITRRRSH